MRVVLLLVLCAGCRAVFGIDDVSLAPDGMGNGPQGPHYHYVIDHEYVPQNNTDITNDSLDLDGDGTIENAIGNALVALAGMGFDTQTPTTHDVDHGEILALVDVQAADFTTSTTAGVQLLGGGNPIPTPCSGTSDAACRHHLDGTGMFTVTSSIDPEMAGAVSGATLLAGPGQATVQISLLADKPVLFHLVAARVQIGMLAAGSLMKGIVAVLGAASLSMANVIKSNVYLTDVNDFAAMNKVYETFFSEPYPARTTVGVAALPGGAHVEIEVVASKDS